jgi:hypothetical protein
VRAGFASVALMLVLAYPVWSIMLRPDLDLWRTDDGEPHLLRMLAMRLAFTESLALPRWASDMYRGYGYPVFNYYAPLTYIGATILGLLGLSAWDAFQVLGLGAIAAGATGAYALVRMASPRAMGYRDHIPAITAGLLYSFAPYPFITNLYIRGDLPEALGLGIAPWFLLAVDRCLVTTGHVRALRATLLASVLGAGLLLVHQLSGAMALGAAVAWAIGRTITGQIARDGLRRAITRLVIGGTVAAGLTAFSVVPTLTEGRSVQLGLVRVPPAEMVEKLAVPFGTVARPIAMHPGADPGLPGAVDWTWIYRYPWGLPPTFGPVKPAAPHAVIALVAVAGAAAVSLLGLIQRGYASAGPVASPALVLGGAWLLNTTWTQRVWEDFPPMQFLQFPSRLYGPFSLGVAVAVGMVLQHVAARSTKWRRAAWTAGTASVLALAIASLANPPIPFAADVSQAVDARALLRTEYNRDAWNGGAATGNSEFTPVGIEIAESIPGRPRGNQVFDRAYPPGSWVGSTALVYAGAARITSLRHDSYRHDIGVEVEADHATVAVHQLWFPGWRAYVDGVPAPIRTPPYDATEDSRLGFQLVDVPSGSHLVTVQFGSTLSRLTGNAITTVTAIGVAASLASFLWRNRQAATVTSRAGWAAATAVAAGVAALAGSQLAFETARSLPPQPLPGVFANAIVTDVAAAVRAGQARISSPTGSELGPDKFIDVRWALVGEFEVARPNIVEFPHGGRLRQWLFMHPTSRVTFESSVTDRDTFFTAGMALRPEAWHTDYGDGVRFAVDVATAGSQPIEVYAQRLNPRANIDERRWVEVRLPLAAYVGQSVEITLRTDPVDDVRNDWAGWGNPMVVVDHTLLRPENGPDVPANVGPRPRF